MAGVKRGGLSEKDKDYVKRFYQRKSTDEIGAHLNRAPSQVAKFVEELSEVRPAQAVTSGLGIERRPEWVRLRNQFDQEELDYFKYRHDMLMTQFGRDDVLPTEEMQIFGLIEAEIMSQQSMAERKVLVIQQKSIQADIEDYYEKIAAEGVTASQKKKLRDDVAHLELKFTQISNGLKVIGERQSSYSMQIKRLLEGLKGSRDQRVKVIEGNKSSFLGHLKALTLEDFRKHTGDDMEVMRVAVEKERKRMAAPHKFADGATDQPLLTSETVMEYGNVGDED